jgi:hypothetical protein
MSETPVAFFCLLCAVTLPAAFDVTGAIKLVLRADVFSLASILATGLFEEVSYSAC